MRIDGTPRSPKARKALQQCRMASKVSQVSSGLEWLGEIRHPSVVWRVPAAASTRSWSSHNQLSDWARRPRGCTSVALECSSQCFGPNVNLPSCALQPTRVMEMVGNDDKAARARGFSQIWSTTGPSHLGQWNSGHWTAARSLTPHTSILELLRD